MKAIADSLDKLRVIFDAHRSRWLAEGHEGEWAVIAPSGDLFGFYVTYEGAFLAASRAFESKPYLLQEVLRQERVEHIQLLGWS